MMRRRLLTAICYLSLVAALAAQKGPISKLEPFDISPTALKAKWDAQLDVKEPGQIMFIVDLTQVSRMKTVNSLTAKVAFFDNGKLLGVESFDLVKGLQTPLGGGEKFVRNVEFDARKYPSKNLSIKPTALDGVVQTNRYVYQPGSERPIV